MNQAVPSSPGSRLARAPFAAAVVVLYALSFASQVLLSPPVTGRMSVIPFVAAQAVLIGAWIVLHQRRLRDAGRPGGTAIGVAMVYALEIVLLTLVVWLMLSAGPADGGGAGSEATILHLFVVLYFLSLLTGDPALGVLQYWVMGFVALMVLPVVVALCYSLWAGTRPSIQPSAASAAP
ncbi:MAG: hypothetical protein K2Z80_17365 [Xanthobacteraceae bacterium]|nr:hypothetical protein [Xanthobacteraceae bacterium]